MKRFSGLIMALALWAPLSRAQNRYVTDVLALNPLGYWRLDGNANDATSHGNGGTLQNGVTFTPPGSGAPIGDPNNQAAAFTSANVKYISIPGTANGSLYALDSNRPMTMAVWAKTSTAANNMVLLAKEENSGNYRGPLIIVDNGDSPSAPKGAGRFLFALQATVSTGAANSGNVLVVETLTSIVDGNWHFLVATYDGSGQASGVRLYIDGVSAATTVFANTLNGLPILNNVPVTIGSRNGGDVPFNGLLDEAAIFGTALTSGQVQQLANDAFLIPKVLPQFVFGGGWYSALYFTNTGTSAVSFPVNFVADDGSPVMVPSVGGSSATINLAPGGTAILEASNTGPLSQGYVSLSLPDGVAGYGVFRQSVPGRADQEAVVPLSSASSTWNTLIWDDTNFTTAVAIVNLGSAATDIRVVVRNGTGATIGTSTVHLGAKSKTAVVLRDLPGLAAMAGNRGSADFTVPAGSVAVLGLRFGGAAFTSIPTTSR